mgnify:CR=1 FL=1
MSKIARAARVASRQRVETLGNGTSAGTDKTIQTAETGELYYIDHNHASALTITLPEKQDGAYFKFVFKTALTDNGGSVVFTTHEDTDGDLVGSIFEQVTGGSNANSAVQADDDADHKLTISDDVLQGSWLEFYCDGTTWVVYGMLNASAVARAAFGT